MHQQFNVAVLGSTGMVGQVFLSMLADHPWFDLVAAVSSDRREGDNYGETATWLLPEPMPAQVAALNFQKLDVQALKQQGVHIIFSALPADVAKGVEAEFRDAGFWVFSNASAYRYEQNVPILIPEVNIDSLSLIEEQGFPEKGFIITNSNCTTAGLAVALAPLRQFGIKKLFLSTYQAISGAGYPGLSALDILDNAIPYIAKEEEKVIIEAEKILGIKTEIYPICVRIPVKFGHLEASWIEFEKDISEQDILDAWADFKLEGFDLPTCPKQPVVYNNANTFPQPKLAFWGEPKGMQVYTGRLRRQHNMFGFLLLANNIVRGAAGGSIINAEAFVQKYQDKL